MANYLSKSKIPVAAGSKHNFPLHRGHITTSGWMQFNVACARELAPETTYKGNHQTFIRTIALKRPLMSSLHVHNTSFFVPFRTVWEPFSDFITDTPHNQPSGTGIIPNVPLISNNAVWSVFINSLYSTALAASATVYDFIYSGTKYAFTAFGRWAYSLFVQLGYKWSPVSKADYTRSALPFLCAAKVYLDFYFPNGYAHYGVYATIDGIFQRQVTYNLSSSEISTILSAIRYVSYNDDYFVNAFDQPTGPNAGTGSIGFVINDLTLIDTANDGSSTSNIYTKLDVQQNNDTGTPAVIMNPAGRSLAFSQYTLDTLHKLESYVRRHQLAGSRALERYLASWGVALSSDKLRRAIKLNESKFPFQIGEVMSTTDTIGIDQGQGGSQLGDYGGRAVAYDGQLNDEFSTDEFGYYFVISTLIPDVGYVQGFDKFTGHKTKLDFLTGEFDGLPAPIDCGELFVGLKRVPAIGDIFGFTGSYAEYKTAKDVLSGSFLFDSVNGGLLGWETMRLWSDLTGDSAWNTTHSLSFMLGYDSSQFNRIFIDDYSSTDPFVMVHRDNFDLIQPACPLYDMFDWSGENQKRISMNVNGVKTN